MSFALERDMTPVVRGWLHGERLQSLSEFQTPWGICDLVGARLNPKHVKQRISLGQNRPIGREARVALLRRIPDVSSGGSMTVRRLIRELAGELSETAVRRELRALEAGRFIEYPRRGHIQRRNGWEPLHERIVAVELKLSRVSEALTQASSHHSFADEVYVALPSDAADRVLTARILADFKATGVGVLSVGTKSCEVAFKSKRVKGAQDATLQMHCAERFWRAMRTAYRTA